MIPKENVEMMQNAVDGDVQAAYRAFVNEKKGITHMYETYCRTGVKADLPEEGVQKLYSEALRENDKEDFEHVREMTGTPVKESWLQEEYRGWLVQNEFGKIRTWKKTTGVKPELSREAIAEGYNTALRSCDVISMEEIRNMTGVEPEFNPEVVQNVYRHLLQDHYEIKDARLVKKVTGIAPDPVILQECYSGALAWCSIKQLKELMEFGGTKPEIREADVQKGYKRIIMYSESGNAVHQIKEMAEFTGITPKMNPDCLRAAYRRTFEARAFLPITKLEKITGVRNDISRGERKRMVDGLAREGKLMHRSVPFRKGVKPSKAAVREGYRHLLKRMDIEGAKNLEKYSGVELEGFEGAADAAYREIFTCYPPRLEKAKAIRELTGVEIQKNARYLQWFYRYPLSSPSRENLRAMRSVMKFTGTEPDSRTVHTAIKNGVIEHDCRRDDAQRLRYALKALGAELDEERVQKWYKQVLRKRLPRTIRNLEKATGIEPEFSRREVLAAHRRHLQWSCHTSDSKELAEITGILPDEKAVRKAYEQYRKNLDIEEAETLKNFTGIEPGWSEEEVQDTYASLYREGHSHDAEALERLTGIKPDKKAKATPEEWHGWGM